MFKNKIANLIQNSVITKEMFIGKILFHFLFKTQSKALKLKLNLDSKCLVLSPYIGAEIKGLGGLIAQYPKNFEVLCFTNGLGVICDDKNNSPALKKQQFSDVMKSVRVKGYKVFDIDTGALKNHYSTFRKIDISEADYIFLPNVFDTNVDTISLLKHFKELLGEKEYKTNLKIFMYECDYPLNVPNYFVDIGSILETKRKILNYYYPKETFGSMGEKILGLNAFRSMHYNCDYVETFLQLTLEEFNLIPML